MSKEVLVVGGAGYVGSHTVIRLKEKGYIPIILDNLSTGHKEAVLGDIFYNCNISDISCIKNIFSKHNIDAVMHFGANCYVGESVVNPHKYFKNNVANTLNLLEAMMEAEVKKFIFSSTAATYGDPVRIPIDETHPQIPLSPYGLSKLFVEQIVSSYENAYGIKHIFLRYFNAAGADPEGRIGEDHYPETHIIPLLIQTALGIKKQFAILGSDYETSDGTCIRDYVHVMDIADAHVKALEYLNTSKTSNEFNLGSSMGYTVKEIVAKVEEITGEKIPLEYQDRREGDPSVLIAGCKKAREVLDWRPRYNIDKIIQTAWDWHKKYPKGFNHAK